MPIRTVASRRSTVTVAPELAEMSDSGRLAGLSGTLGLSADADTGSMASPPSNADALSQSRR